jgi:hypothetical protein
MSDYDLIEARHGLHVPGQYRAVRAKGLFDHDGPNELLLTDVDWMTTEAIANFRPLGFQIEGLVPFARTARRDLYCWYPAWTSDKGIPIAFCPRDDENAICYAPDFFGFLYRILLEEFSGSWLPEDYGIDGTAERFLRYAKDVGQFLPDSWADTLHQLSLRPLREVEKEVYGVTERQKCDELIEKALSFSRLNEEFKHYV